MNGSILTMTTRTYKEAVERRLNGLKEELESGCLDPELYDVLIELNSTGYFTWQSCAGHTRRDGSHGYIAFASPPYKKHSGEVESLLWVLAKHGLEGLRLRINDGHHTVATFAPIGNQYTPGDRLLVKDPYDCDEAGQIPPLPDKCPTCGGSDFWLNGEFYNDKDTMEWMCKQCQPKPFNAGMACMTPEIAKRRKELPKLKLWEVEDEGKKMPFRIRAENESSIYEQLGKDPYENDDDWLFITRIE